MKFDKENLKLYAITEDKYTKHGETLVKNIEATIRGGVTMVQYREKDYTKIAVLQQGMAIREVCKINKIPLIINDSIELTQKLDADGVHLGQSDESPLEARKILGESKIIGVTAKTVEQAMQAENEGADYLGVGAVFPSGTKKEALQITFEQLKKIVQSVKIPVVAIGGINSENIELLQNCGISGIAVIGALFDKPDKCLAAKNLKIKVNAILEK